MTTVLLSFLALAVLALWVHILWRSASGLAGLQPLTDNQGTADPTILPRLSVIVAARNEQEAIVECLNGLMAQDLPDLQVVVVNDRSTDQTGPLIDQAAAREDAHDLASHPGRPLPHPRHQITPIHLSEKDLPEGWLGKCNALAHGTKAATGDWFLFLDGDILLHPSTLRLALARAHSSGAGHLCLFPSMIPGSVLEQSMMLAFSLAFIYRFHPAHAMNPKRPEYIGVGAFNMVRRDAYEAIGGHAPLRMMIIDDVALGAFVKRAGFPISVASGGDHVRVRWYPSVLSMIVGLEKNAFAGLDYSLTKTLMACLGLFLLAIAPVLMVVFAPWPSSLLALPSALLLPLLGWAAARRQAFGGIIPGLLLPLGTVLFIFTLLRSAIMTLRQGGVRWRDSFYPLADLRRFTLPR